MALATAKLFITRATGDVNPPSKAPPVIIFLNPNECITGVVLTCVVYGRLPPASPSRQALALEFCNCILA